MADTIAIKKDTKADTTFYLAEYAAGARSIGIKEAAKKDYGYQPTKYKAVDQNPTAGTIVATGSKIIVYFEDTDDMHIDILEGAHAGYTGKKASDIIEIVKNNEAVEKIVNTKEKSEDLTPEEEVIMVNFFIEALGLEMDENDAAKNNKAAYDVMAASYALLMK